MRIFTFFMIFIMFFCINKIVLSQCSAGETLIQLNIVPDDWGSEITWQFTGPGGSPTYSSGGPYFDNNTTPVNEDVCVPTGTQVIFTIFDSYGDGICCSEGNGSYSVTVNGVMVATGGEYSTSESTTFFAPVLAYDISMDPITSPFPVLGTGETVSVKGSLRNTSSTTISSLTLSYKAGSEPVVTETFNGLSVAPAGEYQIEFSTLWTPLVTGNQAIRVWLNYINAGNLDLYNDNDTVNINLDVYQGAVIPNRMDDFLAAPPVYSTIATSSNQLNKPTDLDFHSDLNRKELWVINEDTEITGGSTVTIFNAGLSNQSSVYLRDGNAWHFMSLPTALAFGTNSNWASSPGVYDANHDGGAPFTGPTLWSSDMSIYAQNAGPGTNGSHLDMLHETPHGMGIAHHKDNAYWVFDGNSGNIVYYDFVQDHGPGQSYHGDAIIKRYPQVSVLKDSYVPSHLILDKNTGWLYIVDTGNDRVLRMNTNTGTVQSALTGYEAVAEYSQMTGVVSETVIDTGLTRPCGIDIVDNRMIIGDYNTGDIRFYDISVNPVNYLGSLSTGPSGLTGLKIGPEGNIWFTNRLTNRVRKIVPSVTTDIEVVQEPMEIHVFPNPVEDQLNLHFGDKFDFSALIRISDPLGRTIVETSLNNKKQISFNCSDWLEGMYLLSVQNGKENISKIIQVR
ncbi:MAG: T9SS type A sorting domain-containing protein [Saprospiraceae bacterium]|nr:T9SS type A sorting domain-containing protein [Saprospiraceae bacterium]